MRQRQGPEAPMHEPATGFGGVWAMRAPCHVRSHAQPADGVRTAHTPARHTCRIARNRRPGTHRRRKGKNAKKSDETAPNEGEPSGNGPNIAIQTRRTPHKKRGVPPDEAGRTPQPNGMHATKKRSKRHDESGAGPAKVHTPPAPGRKRAKECTVLPNKSVILHRH